MRYLAGILLVLGACGDEGSAEQRLEGVWAAEVDGLACAAGLVFEADGQYRRTLICELESGALAAERDEGAYVVWADDGEIEFRPERGSCRSMRSGGDYTLRYRMPSEDQLVTTASNGQAVYRRLESSGSGSGFVLFGCWADGSFIEEALGPY